MACLASYPGADVALGMATLGLLANLKMPWEMRAGASKFTSLDRRLPSAMGASTRTGATVTRGTIGRVKFVGRYGTVAVAVAGLGAGYLIGAGLVCAAQ